MNGPLPTNSQPPLSVYSIYQEPKFFIFGHRIPCIVCMFFAFYFSQSILLYAFYMIHAILYFTILLTIAQLSPSSSWAEFSFILTVHQIRGYRLWEKQQSLILRTTTVQVSFLSLPSSAQYIQNIQDIIIKIQMKESFVFSTPLYLL